MMPLLAVLLSAVPLLFGEGTNILSRGERLTIASRRCDMDRKSGIVLFDGRVRVDYQPGYTLCAEHVFALFTGTNELERLVAAGNVAITNGARVGFCDRAVFWRDREEIDMSGWHDGRMARLIDESSNSIAGRKLKFWLNAEQVEITDSELTVNKDGRSVKDL